jgi:8-oxo-dGTP diphosphatase
MASLGTEFGFPTVYWPAWDVDATFMPCETLPPGSKGKLYAVIAHCFFGDNLVLADIEGRGPTVPSGRIETGETIDQTLEREVYEETGAMVHPSLRRMIGVCVLKPRKAGAATRYCPVFIAEVTTFEPIPAGSESKGFLLIAPEAVADTYYSWDPLLESQFEYALEQRERHFTAGTSMAQFMTD